jgi:hypothetical protein
MKTSIFARTMGLVAAALLAAAGCDEGKSTTGDGGSAGDGGAGAGNTNTGEGAAGGGGSTGSAGSDPGNLSIIDNMEDGDGSIVADSGRKGAWYTYNDESATGMQTPEVGLPFEMAPLNPPRDGSTMAANTKGSGFDTWGSGFGFDLNNAGAPAVKEAYDASKYSGISFWAKVGAGSVGAIRVNLGDKNTTPEGGVCEAAKCSDDFGKDITVGSDWKQYNIKFAEMGQVGWSMVLLPAIEKSAIYSVHFQTVKGATFDIWIDDVAFTE